MRILWIEDDADELIDMVRPLQHDNHEVLIAYDAEQAIEILSHEHFDLILLDCLIPEGNINTNAQGDLVGLALLKMIKDSGNRIPTVVFSVFGGSPHIAKKFADLGATKILAKGSMDPGDLKKQIYDIF
jgi:CheY-like chemotaxis protein